MSRFNAVSSGTKTKNLAGGEAYTMSPELKIVSILLTSFANDQYYRSANQTFSELKSLLKEVDPLFAAKAAIYARTEFGMRSISHVLSGELIEYTSGKPWARKFFKKIAHRPDDMVEIISYLKSKNKKIPHALRKGFSDAFEKFDSYQLAKYRSEGKKIKLVDVVRLVHPKYTEATTALVKGELTSTHTWESKLTQAGQKAKDESEKETLKKEAWTQLIKTGRISYMALLKNLRNIVQQAPDIIDKACELLTNENRIKKSLVLPFRYATAIEELSKVEGSRKVVSALNVAAEIALNNVPEFSGKTLIAVDVSGSMGGKPEKIARLFGSILYKTMDSVLLTFDSRAQIVNLDPNDGVLSLMKQIPFRGGGTNFNVIFDALQSKVDRIFILSDEQAWERGTGYYSSNPREAYNRYRAKTGADPKIYSFDLQGYGSLQFPENNVYCVAGFSEKIFDLLKLLETDRKAMINKIKSIEI